MARFKKITADNLALDGTLITNTVEHYFDIVMNEEHDQHFPNELFFQTKCVFLKKMFK